MAISSYRQRRAEIEHYFDHTAAEAWSKLTSNSPVGRIRSTVRAGRDSMRSVLLEHLGPDLHGKRILDAGCGTGALSFEAARRGAEVVAIDLSPSLVKLAQERSPAQFNGGSIDFRVGDMLDSSLGSFDHIVAMDSLIHYRTEDALDVIAGMAKSSHGSIQFTFAPHTPLLGMMHAVGKFFPAGNRAPSIVPVREVDLHAGIESDPRMQGWRIGRTNRIKSGFYQSQALEIVKI
jgi:magnesium-protoporphyrin O-methyltransferase